MPVPRSTPGSVAASGDLGGGTLRPAPPRVAARREGPSHEDREH
ncbi:MAG: hypothetical protein AVDCRST_MAG77-2378 [uncultured Chloroflexi bacterium]|uniref:Uncharacterized protein n=1 Tax=uncultured Chloroflexota bacterium TaxID=166587 RepID=A0A6J4IKE2_9CHLR|nr:MAG: hypothetical protein AVDCRST_MAG77-2378 [uncultured Chloroflexota bacterium]